MDRDLGIDRLASEAQWDILVIGGGATGLGCALDAASRGYRVVLAERFDFAQGTSSRSTKLVHGGVRYLKQGNLSLVKGALRERGLLFQNAPHLVRPISFIIPAHHWWDIPYYATGLKAYDWLAGNLGIEKSKGLDKEATLAALPSLKPETLRGGIQYWDGQFDDARLAIDLASTIWEQGGLALNYLAAQELIKENGKVVGALCEDTRKGRSFEVRANCVINATGVFSDSIRAMDQPGVPPIIKASQGAHIVVSQELLPLKSALIIPKTTDGRVLFAIPWLNRVLLGTTDTPVDRIETDPIPFAEEIDFIIENATNYLDVSIGSDDIKSAYAGLRPLVSLKSSGGSTASLSRDHHIEVSDTGLLTIAGGKWTTFRKMAQDAVNKAESLLGASPSPCKTETLRISSNQPSAEGTQLHPELPYTIKQVEHSILHEMPQTLEDVLSRRTRCLALDRKAAADTVDQIAPLMVRHGLLEASDAPAAIAAFKAKAANA